MRHIWLRVMMVAALAAPCALQGAVSGLVCTSTSVQAVLRTEGLTERAGEMVFTCTGDTPGGEVGASFSVFLSVPVTNRAGGDGMFQQLARFVGFAPFGRGDRVARQLPTGGD